VVLFECIGVGCDSVMELALKSGRDPSTARAGALRAERRKKPARSGRDDVGCYAIRIERLDGLSRLHFG
jgi:hypothetical protein